MDHDWYKKKTKTGNKVAITLVCAKCGYTKKGIKKKLSNNIPKKTENPKKYVTVLTKETLKLNTLPTLKVECPKCGNKKVYVWQVQTRGGDESSTQFMRCTKCDHTFREYT